MDACAQVLLGFPPEGPEGPGPASLSDEAFDAQLKLHAGRVQKLFKDASALVAAHAAALLDHLDPAVHTYSYLSLLDTIIPTDAALYASVPPVVAAKLAGFLAAFDARQVRYTGSAFTHLFTAVGSGKILPARVAVELLARALEALDPSGGMMTSNHLTLAKLAYHTNNAAAALPVLGRDVVFFPGVAALRESERLCSLGLSPASYISKDTGLSLPLRSTQVLEFDYIVGLLHLAVRGWAAAHAAFARVVSHPTRDGGVSKIMVDAHKYWVLTGLLLFGKAAGSPPSTAASVARVCAAINKVYVLLAEHFQLADAKTLKAEVALSATALTAAGTMGLVQEVVDAHPKWQIAHLRDVYTKITIADIRKTLKSPPEPKPAAAAGDGGGGDDNGPGAAKPDSDAAADAHITALLQGMIDDGMVRAVLRPAAAGGGAYLEFLPDEEAMTEAQFAKQAARIAARVQALKPLHRTTDEHLSLNREYIRQYMRDMRREREAGTEDDDMAGALRGYGHSFDLDMDEDLMADNAGDLALGGFT